MNSHSPSTDIIDEQAPEGGAPTLSLLRQDTRGLSTVEYIILLSLIVVAAFGTWQKIGGKIKSETVDANTALQEL
jgi:hypothetical protein